MDADFILALQLQEQFDIEYESASPLPWSQSDSSQSNKPTVEPGGGGRGPSSVPVPRSSSQADPERPMSVVDESWELLDPSPDVRAMFLTFNDRFFWGKLSGVEVKWSPRMTLCAGVCSYEGRGGLCSIRLSAPLLKLRPRRDLVETLLHEMIHALLFVTANNRDRDGHGPEFCKHMDRINKDQGTKISIYHTFNDEVDAYRTHWWRCDGPCQNRKPYLGYVKRSMNRAPSALDNWWEDHRRSCGGTYIKVKEPEGYKSKKNGKELAAVAGGSNDKKTPEMQAPGKSKSSKPTPGSGLQDIRGFIPFSGKGLLLGGTSSSPSTSTASSSGDQMPKRPLQIPAFSPKKPLFSPSSQTNALPSLRGSLGSPVKGSHATSPWNRTGPSMVQKPPKKRSVGNTRYFTNVKGSPVKLANPVSRGTKTGIPSGNGGDPAKTTKGSIKDLFNSRSLKTSSPSATVSKPPDETTGAVPSCSRNSSSAVSESSLSTAIATTFKPSFNTVKKEDLNQPSVFPTASNPSLAKPTKPSFITIKKEETNHPSVFPTASNPGFAKPNHSNHSGHANHNSIAGAGASRKRPLNDSAGLFSFLREALGSESPTSPTSPEVKRSRVSPSAHASSAAVAEMPSSQAKQATTSSTFTNSSSSFFPSSKPSIPSTSAGAASSSFSSSNPSIPSTSAGAASSSFPSSSPSIPSTSARAASSSFPSSSPSIPSTSGLHAGAASSSWASVSCPVCQVKVQQSKINEHLDSCLSVSW